MVFLYTYINKPEKDTRDIETEVSLTTNEIIAYIDNADNDHLKNYINKAIEVEGTVKELTFKNNIHSILLSSDNKERLVLCQMQQGETSKMENIKEGELVKIKGIYKGSLLDAILLNCIFIQ